MEEQAKIDALSEIEKLIFVKPLTAELIKKNLDLTVSYESLGKMQDKMYSRTGIGRPATWDNSLSLSREKDKYERYLDEMINRINSIKAASQGKSDLLGRCKKCEEEISKIRSIVQSF